MLADHHSPTPPGHDHATEADIAMAELLELDAEVLRSYLAGLTGWLASLVDREPVRILDLGSGPGTGTLALARQFSTATVTAVDLSPQMLHRLGKRAMEIGVADRVQTLQADLDQPWPQPEHSEGDDLIWTATFLHHVADPDLGLAQAFDRLRPGGLLAVTEMDFFPRLLPEDAGIGRPGLEAGSMPRRTPDHPTSGASTSSAQASSWTPGGLSRSA